MQIITQTYLFKENSKRNNFCISWMSENNRILLLRTWLVSCSHILMFLSLGLLARYIYLISLYNLDTFAFHCLDNIRRYRPKNVLASLRYQKGIEQKDLHGKGLNSWVIKVGFLLVCGNCVKREDLWVGHGGFQSLFFQR